MTKFSKVFLVTSILCGLSSANAQQTVEANSIVIPMNDEIVKEVVITKVAEEYVIPFNVLDFTKDCSVEKEQKRAMGIPVPAVNPADIDPGDIIAIGKKAWEIIRDNEPILEAKTTMVSALPRGIHCWDDLATWSPTRSEVFKVQYKNLYKMDVVVFDFRLVYSHSGSYRGVGQYLANATLQYANINVLWGYIFNADVEVPEVLNIGREEAPIGGMQMTMNWTLRTRPISLKKSMNSVGFFIGGDGRPTRVLE